MSFFELADNSMWANWLLFTLSAGGVWIFGTKLSSYVDLIADRTGVGRAFAGALLLGGATSLPELGTTLTASASGAAQLAGNNLLGGILMQLAVLAVVDALLLRGKALTLFSPTAALLIQGIFLIFILALALAAISTGELFTIAGIGAWPILFTGVYVAGLWLVYRYEGNPRWMPAGEVEEPPESARDLKDAHKSLYREVSTKQLCLRFGIGCLGVLVSGFVVARVGETLAEQTGLGQSFVGATLVALATTLPEVSTTWSAVRFGAYSMAIGNILGTNSLEVALFLPADLAYRTGGIIDALNPSAAYLGALGIMATSIYLWGILERRDRTILGMGQDSFVILCLYFLGIGFFYFLGM
ncbi:sodium:calcium antiporter [Bythopirellula goksoeyrii]|uniref:Putative calcium/sodium:proton antiporter n=1 Tax=Bythopirellula goksoeyrii TaxID=1400387 RepID=A0A5B9Q6M9_9BACT|nr:sodium:calcium antiporter [Bythopirellula goksoeyrii]QEG33369.1 putative calcium/sodium:proton antiporter [Bythopirellula goksoeyrii]